MKIIVPGLLDIVQLLEELEPDIPHVSGKAVYLWLLTQKLRNAASIEAAVATGFSMGNRWLPSSIMMRPLVILSVAAMPTCFISTEASPPMKATGYLTGWCASSCSKLSGTVL